MTKIPSSSDGKHFESGDFAVGPFKPHGHSDITRDGEIFWIETEGPFNLEAIVAINRTRTKLIESAINERRYAYINTWRTSALMSMEALQEYRKGLEIAYADRRHAPAAIAWIFPESIEGASMMRPHYERLFASINLPFGIFNHVDAAVAFTKEKLATP